MFDGMRDCETDPPNRTGGVLMLLVLAAICWCFVVFLCMIAWAAVAHAEVQADPRAITWSNCTTLTITTGGTAQTAVTAVPPVRGFFLQNEDTLTTQGIAAAENLYFQPDGTAVIATSPFLLPGASISFGPGTIFASSLSLIATSTGHKFVCLVGR